MARQQRKIEGDEQQRRQLARDARAKGKAPSELGATLGASKQLKQAKGNASHQERVELRGEGKRGPRTSGKPRPGSRKTDEKRTDRWQ